MCISRAVAVWFGEDHVSKKIYFIIFGACISLLAAGCSRESGALPAVTSQAPTNNGDLAVQPAPIAAQSTLSSTSAGPSVIAAAYGGTSLDQYSTKFRWMTYQYGGSILTELRRADVYSDFYLSSIREVASSGGSQPDWNTVNLHEDAFLHGADPASLTLQPQSGAVTLHWASDARTSMGPRGGGYVVYEGRSPSSLSAIKTLGSSTTSYTASGLSNRSTYYFAVRSLLNGQSSVFSWVESATAGTPSGYALDSPSYSTSSRVAPGASLALTVRVHASGASLPSSLRLQTLIRPSETQSPSTATMSSVGGGYYQGSARIYIPSDFYGGIAFRIANAAGSAVLPSPANQSYYITSPNNRLHFAKFPNNYVMDAGAAAWQSLLTAYVSGRLAGGYQGVLFDDYGTSLVGARPEAYPPGYSDSSYRDKRVSELRYLRSNIPSAYSICINAFSDPAASVFLPYVQRGVIEEIAYDSNSWKYAPDWYWTQSLDNVLSLLSHPELLRPHPDKCQRIRHGPQIVQPCDVFAGVQRPIGVRHGNRRRIRHVLSGIRTCHR